MPKLDKRANALIIEWCDAILMATRELTRVLGVTARRGLQFQGSPDSPDVVTEIEGIHIECKRAEKFSLYSALNQAIDDAGTNIPVVCHRQNHKPWVTIVRLDDLPKLASIFAQYQSFSKEDLCKPTLTPNSSESTSTHSPALN